LVVDFFKASSRASFSVGTNGPLPIDGFRSSRLLLAGPCRMTWSSRIFFSAAILRVSPEGYTTNASAPAYSRLCSSGRRGTTNSAGIRHEQSWLTVAHERRLSLFSSNGRLSSPQSPPKTVTDAEAPNLDPFQFSLRGNWHSGPGIWLAFHTQAFGAGPAKKKHTNFFIRCVTPPTIHRHLLK
jgi:hypothetical protein